MLLASFFRFKQITVVIGCIIFLSSCAQKIGFVTSSAVPAAEGQVKVKKDDNNNYSIKINMKNLAEPKRLTPSRSTYVVWMDSDGNGSKNLGQLKSSSGLFSSALKASLETTSPYKPKRIFITAEDSGDIQYPGTQVVLTTNTF